MNKQTEFLTICKEIIEKYIEAEKCDIQYAVDINEIEVPPGNGGNTLRRKHKYMFYEFDRKKFRLVFDMVKPKEQVTLK